jgi:hypothetical protein
MLIRSEHKMDRKKFREVRSIILKDLKRDLIGPDHAEVDILNEPPSQAYISGILYPLESELPIEEEDLDDPQYSKESPYSHNERGDYNPPDEADEKIELNKGKKFKQQNSMGIRFYIQDSIDHIIVKGGWGQYKKSSKYNEEKEKEVSIWIRDIVSFEETIYFNEYSSPIEIRDNIYLFLKRRRIRGTNNYLVSIFLSNRNVDKNSNNALFQVQLKISHSSNQGIFLNENSARKDNGDFDEFLYRNKPIFAKGYGCAVDWTSNNNNFATELRTEFIPDHEIGSMSTEVPSDEVYGEIPKGYFSIKRLAEVRNKDDVIDKLNNLADRYENWINNLPIDDVGDKVSAKINIKKCHLALSRIREGIEILDNNPSAFKAFKFMNSVMHTQISMKNYGENRENSTLEQELQKENFDWRPFQLAFILLNIKGLVEPNTVDREIVDLLYFPTGGGKTEAYLGVAAFTLGYRRITANQEVEFNKDGGVSIFLRYTLRLLTTQQRDRLMRVICACEYLRVTKFKGQMGSSEFSVGFWVGSGVTPNKFEDLEENQFLNRKAKQVEAEYKKIQRQVLECPCCGDKNLDFRYIPNNHTATKKTGLEIYCTNSMCFFSTRHIPIYLIDEDIYRKVPSVVISTVDKFARLPWDEKTATLFGKVNRFCGRCGYIGEGEEHKGSHKKSGNIPAAKVYNIKPFYPPELIIQDEGHLISGPLGTIYGLYETAIEELCTREISGVIVKPKYIAATATIRNSEEQIKRIFGRTKVQQFPPAGLEIEDSFFAREVSVEKNPFRLYAGVCVSGHSMKTVLLRVYASLLQTTENLIDHPEYKDYLDPYRTLIGYFNSVRELGGAVRLLDDDIKKRIQLLQKKYNYIKQRYINRTEELTSRIPSYKIPKVLDLLKKEIGNEELDVALATNMISVGMDVDRLGLMAIAGQPKQTSEYIQASSRVGRNKPGLVITIYNAYRPRDLSHYQNFKGYHSRLYYYVEGTTATPFASRARDRALHAIAVALLRLAYPELAKNEDAINIRNVSVNELIEIIEARVNIVEPKNVKGTIQELNTFLDQWISLSSSKEPLEYYYFSESKKARMNNVKRLLRRFGERRIKNSAVQNDHERPTLDAMRQVEGNSKLYLYEGWNE